MTGGSSRKAEPPDETVLEIDPTNRYICYKEEVGKGAYKTVYKAFDQIDGIEVAWNQVKIDEVMSSPLQEMERLYAEVHLLRSLEHTNILKLYDWWVDEEEKTLNIITELFTSGSLKQYCNKHKKVDIKAVKGWARQILSGLDFLHSQKPPIIHRDIKCDNIFINGNHGEVKIGDFGLATVMRQSSARSVLGTPGFVAPELYDEDYNELVDIYSFGMCILQMVTSEYPYSECENSAQIFKKVCSGIRPVGLSKVIDPEVKAFIEKCIAPVYERLPARELLKDPFLVVSGLNGLKLGYPLPLPHTCIERSIASKDPSIMSEKSQIDISDVPDPLFVDFLDDKPPIINVISSFSEGKFISQVLSIQKKASGNEFVLLAKKKDRSSVFFNLQIAKWKAPSVKIDFVFYLEMDTSITVATKLVEKHEAAITDMICISELIDSLLVNLVSDWKPSVTIDQLAILGKKQICYDETETIPPDTSVCLDPCFAELTSAGALIQTACDANDSLNLDDIIHGGKLEASLARINDHASKVSHISIATGDENEIRSSVSCQYSCTDAMESNAQVICEETRCVECSHGRDVIGVMNRDVGPFHGIYDVYHSSVMDNPNDNDEQLKVELEIIELCYREVINYASQKMNLAIADAKSKVIKKEPALDCND